MQPFLANGKHIVPSRERGLKQGPAWRQHGCSTHRSLTGARIETTQRANFARIDGIVPSRERGLKRRDPDTFQLAGPIVPSRERGLKPGYTPSVGLRPAIVPSRERGLKLCNGVPASPHSCGVKPRLFPSLW